MKTSTFSIISTIFLSGCFGQTKRSPEPRLQILPSGSQEIRAGKNLVLTCRAQVPNQELIKDLKWIDPQGQIIAQDNRVYSESHTEEAAISLFIKRLTSEDAGLYKCSAIYAANQELVASVSVSIIIGITWSDAPTEQYASLGTDYKLMCKVQANPPANIDWLKESVIVSSVDGQEEKTINMIKESQGDRYVIETDGLLIKQISKPDGGTFTCRARVPQTGDLEERNIILDVQEPPSWVLKPSDVQGIETEKAEFKCQALGSPHPSYTWVDTEGIDATDREGWKLEANTGTLIAYQLERKDAGQYTCIAENNAGRLKASAQLNVIIKPKVQELQNQTFPVGKEKGVLTCKASGDPLPKIIWRKWSRNDPYLPGGQPDDSRITIEEQTVEAPDYTEGERNWQQSTLTIDTLKRTDDGLYECQAVNEGGKFFQSGHLTVEFGPTFEDQQTSKEWSWDQRQTNLSCMATAIPNATISWWFRDLEIGREDLDQNYDIVGHGPLSILAVSPFAGKYYGHYSCKADNIYGSAIHEIELIQAHEPTQIQQAVLDKVTSTTLQFRFVPPTNIGGLPLDAYAVEYKETRHLWNQARRRVWPIAENGEYILEDLSPKTTFDLRFGCKNRVGFSPWGAGQQVTMPKRGRPEPPILNAEDYGMPGFLNDGGFIELDSSNQYELSWQIPEDNGLPIDMFLLQYYPVRVEQSYSDSWVQTGDIVKIEIQNRGSVRHTLDMPYRDTYVKIVLQAHNEYGFSDESVLIVRAGREKEEVDEETHNAPFTASQLPLIPIIGSLLAVLVLLIILIDISCYKINEIGFTNFLCEKAKRFKKFDPQIESAKLNGQCLTSTHTLQGFGSGKVTGGMNTGRSEEVSLQTHSNQKLATIKRSKSKEQIPRNRAIACQSVIFSSPPLEGIYAAQEERDALNEQLLHNIYDATPDHSILKHGLAKSLSSFHIEDVGQENRRKPSSQPNSVYTRNLKKKQMTPKHIMKKKTSVNANRDPHQSLPTLTIKSNSLLEISKMLAETTDFLKESFDTFSESSETESHQDLGLDLSGFEKTKDFGDFVTFSNSPAIV